jgi:hypothetical protein
MDTEGKKSHWNRNVGKRACTFWSDGKKLHKGMKTTTMTRRQFSMIHEYPLDGKPPMMTHVFENKEGKRIIAKAVQTLYKINLSTEQQQQIQDIITLTSKGISHTRCWLF